MNAVFEKKINDFKNRLLKKKYEYRQFDNAAGIWLKLKIEISAASQIIGFKKSDIAKFDKIINLKRIGVLSSLKNEMIFYSTKENIDLAKYNISYSILESDLQSIINSGYEVIIFLE